MVVISIVIFFQKVFDELSQQCIYSTKCCLELNVLFSSTWIDKVNELQIFPIKFCKTNRNFLTPNKSKVGYFVYSNDECYCRRIKKIHAWLLSQFPLIS